MTFTKQIIYLQVSRYVAYINTYCFFVCVLSPNPTTVGDRSIAIAAIGLLAKPIVSDINKILLVAIPWSPNSLRFPAFNAKGIAISISPETANFSA